MSLLRLFLSCCLQACTIVVFAQTNNPASLELAGTISKEFPEAKAYIEYHTTAMTFSVADPSMKAPGGTLQMRLHKKNGYLSLKDQVEIPVMEIYDSFSSIDQISAFYRKEEKFEAMKPIVFDKYIETEGIFHNDARYKFFEMKLSSKGCRYKTEIEKSYTDYKFIDALYFHESLPQQKHTISIIIPANVSIELYEFNFEGFDIQKKETTDVKTNIKTITYSLMNIRPYKVEKGSTGTSTNLPHIVLVVKSFSISGIDTKCFESYNDFYTFLHNLNGEVEQHNEMVEDLAHTITKGKKSDEEKIKALYYWVQDNIRYIAFEYGIAGFKPMSARDVIVNKYGDCKGVANLLACLLKALGYDARFVWIHTNYSKYTCTLPYLGIFNHAICALYYNNHTYFLDCTESYAAFGENAYRIQGRPAMVENGNQYNIETIPFETINSSGLKEQFNVRIHGDTLTGTCQTTAYGDLKNQYLRLYHYAETENKPHYFKKYYSRSNNNMQVIDVSTSDLNNREIPFYSNYTFDLSNHVIKDEHELFVNLELEQLFSKTSADTIRMTDYTFDMTVNYNVIVVLDIPPGYEVLSVPAAYAVKNDYCNISLQYAAVNNKVLYTKSFIFPDGVIPKEKTAEWFLIQQQLKAFYSDQITLIKQ